MAYWEREPASDSGAESHGLDTGPLDSGTSRIRSALFPMVEPSADLVPTVAHGGEQSVRHSRQHPERPSVDGPHRQAHERARRDLTSDSESLAATAHLAPMSQLLTQVQPSEATAGSPSGSSAQLNLVGEPLNAP